MYIARESLYFSIILRDFSKLGVALGFLGLPFELVSIPYRLVCTLSGMCKICTHWFDSIMQNLHINFAIILPVLAKSGIFADDIEEKLEDGRRWC